MKSIKYFPTNKISKSAHRTTWFIWRFAVVQWLTHMQFFGTPWTIAHQAPLSMGFSRQEYWSGWPFPSPGDVPRQGTKPTSPCIGRQILYHWPTKKGQFFGYKEVIVFHCRDTHSFPRSGDWVRHQPRVMLTLTLFINIAKGSCVIEKFKKVPNKWNWDVE